MAALPVLLADVAGAGAGFARVRVLSGGVDGLVAALCRDDNGLPEHVLKVERRRGSDDLSARRAAVDRALAGRTSIPTAAVVRRTISACGGWTLQLSRFVLGEEWAAVRERMPETERRSVLRQIGETLARIHDVAASRFGELDDASGRGAARLTAALLDRAQRAIRRRDHRRVFASVLRSAREAVDRIEGPCLCHGDLHQHNVVVSRVSGEWRLAAILDFDKAWAGPAMADLACMDLWDGMQGRDLLEGYARVRAVPVHHGDVALLFQLLWCLEFAAPTERHHADTERVCRALGIEPIRFDC